MSRDKTLAALRRSARTTFKARFELLAGIRESYCQRAEQCSALTDPYLFPKDGVTGEKVASPYQSVGAEGVTNLSSRILNIILPPNRPPFRLRVEKNPALPEEKRNWQQIEEGLAQLEKMVCDHIETLEDRVVIAEAIPHLLVTGNVLLHVRKDGIRLHSLRNYVVSRDPRGNVAEIIVREKVDPRFLALPLATSTTDAPENDRRPEDKASYKELFTQIKRTENGWSLQQEVDGKFVSKHGHYKKDECPWLPLRMYRVSGESYGRGYVEKYLGDHKSLEALTKAIVEGAAACAKVVFLVSPNGTLKAKQLEEAGNLAILTGSAAEVSTVQVQKANDFQIAKALADNLQQRLSRAYLLNSAIQRNAERVTAEEIRYMAQELETALGGLYSMLSMEFQHPYVKLRMKYMKEDALLPDLAQQYQEGKVGVKIVTGIDALGRGQDASRLTEWAGIVFKTIGPQVALPYINASAFMKALANSMGIDGVSLLKSQEEIETEQEQSQQNQLLQNVAPNAVNQIGALLGKRMDAENQEQSPIS